MVACPVGIGGCARDTGQPHAWRRLTGVLAWSPVWSPRLLKVCERRRYLCSLESDGGDSGGRG